MNKIIKLEVLIATPPTSKCEETIEVLKEVVRRHPDETCLVVFRRGVDFMPPGMQLTQDVSEEDLIPKEASFQMRVLTNKGRGVPSVVVDGELYSTTDVPDLGEIDAKVREILQSTTKQQDK
jgi:hypothetical protein